MIKNIIIEFPTISLETQCLLVHNSTPNGLSTCFIDATPNEEITLNKLLAHYYKLLADSLENNKPLPKGKLSINNWQFTNCYPMSHTYQEGILINWLYQEIKIPPT